MRLLLWGDTQFHPWFENERPNHWKLLTTVIKKVYVNAVKKKCDHVVFMGDLFESKRSLRSDIVSTVFSQLIKWHSWAELPSTFIAGNHDWYEGHCILAPLGQIEGICVCYKSQTTIQTPNGGRVTCIPFNGKIQPTRHRSNKNKLAFFHEEVSGGMFGASTTPRTTSKNPFPSSFWDSHGICFGGHLHSPQSFTFMGTRIVYVGSPYHVNWSDADTGHKGRGAVLLDTNKPESYKRIYFDYPRFWNSPGPHVREGDFVRDLSALKEAAHNTLQHENHDIIGGSDIDEAIEQYVYDKEEDEKRAERLAQLGIELYRRGGHGN